MQCPLTSDHNLYNPRAARGPPWSAHPSTYDEATSTEQSERRKRELTDDVGADGDGDDGLGGAEGGGVRLHRAGRGAAAAAGVAQVQVLHRRPLHRSAGSGLLRHQGLAWLPPVPNLPGRSPPPLRPAAASGLQQLDPAAEQAAPLAICVLEEAQKDLGGRWDLGAGVPTGNGLEIYEFLFEPSDQVSVAWIISYPAPFAKAPWHLAVRYEPEKHLSCLSLKKKTPPQKKGKKRTFLFRLFPQK